MDMNVDYGALQKAGGAFLADGAGVPDEREDYFLGCIQPHPTRIWLAAYGWGLFIFVVTITILNTAFYSHPDAVRLYICFVLFLSFHAIVTQKPLHKNQKSVWCRTNGITSIPAVLFGSILGLYCFDAYGYFSFIYRNSRTYENTVPSEPAASVADAGRMVFAREAFVDQTKASGYAAENGYTYCVAPVRDAVADAHIQFWAVGYDCCDWTGKFECDDASDGEARGGIVVFDNPGYFVKSNRDYYDQSRQKSEAYFGLVSAKEPLYVRWVKNDRLNMLRDAYALWTSGFIILWTFVYAVVSFGYTRSQLYFYERHYENFFHHDHI